MLCTAFCKILPLTVFSKLLEFFKEVNVLGSIVYPARVINVQSPALNSYLLSTPFAFVHCSMYLVCGADGSGRALSSLSLELLRWSVELLRWSVELLSLSVELLSLSVES
jgi:hypothetical protein